jgi:hypothetical protein
LVKGGTGNNAGCCAGGRRLSAKQTRTEKIEKENGTMNTYPVAGVQEVPVEELKQALGDT